ncbi:MAG: PAS domain S-box protein [Rhodothermales bacterium]|nr:PAS domain S-box protein [Rhodothermales bacterium]MBO6778170.1 PAS domain S-box protein [Rhodothermales bacterium]
MRKRPYLLQSTTGRKRTILSHEQILVYVREDWRQLLLTVPGVRLLDAPPEQGTQAPAVVDHRHADAVLASRPSFPVVVAMPEYDLEEECRWLGQGADACLFLTEDLPVRVPQCAERARARRRAMNRIRKEDLRYRAMVENLLDVVTLLDGFGVILHQSPSVTDVFGWEPKEMLGRNAIEFVHPADVPRILQLIAEGREIPSMRASTQYRFKHKDGGWRVVESKAVNLLHDMAVQSIVVVSRDTTERQQSEDSLRASRGRLAALLDAIPDAYVLVDREGTYRDVHIPSGYPSAQSAAELIGQSVREALPMPLAERAHQAVQQVLKTGVATVFDYSIDVNGSTRFREARIVPFDSELVLSVQRDITDRMKALEQVRLSEIRFRSLFEASPDAIFVESEEGIVLDANPAACELHGAEREWLVGRSVEELVPPRFRREVGISFRQLVEGSLTRGEGFSMRKDGKSVPIEFSVGRTVYGEQSALLLHVRDISKRKAQEALIRKLGSYRQSAIEKERARISREVHDVLGQALTGLRFDISRLGRQVGPEYESHIVEANGAIDAIIDDVRRISAELRPGILDDLGIAAAVEWQAKALGNRSGIEVELDIEHALQSDPERSTALFRVCQEMMTNVARHAKASKMWVSLSKTDEKLLLRVADDGKGLDLGSDSETERVSLGLLGIRERLQPWGGTFELRENEPRGTVAVATLPLNDAHPRTHS